MRVLFVTPSEVGSGEAITALHMAESIEAQGGEVLFLASRFTAGFLMQPFPGRVTMFTRQAEQNREVWDRSLQEFGPDVVVFADYPLLFFSNGASPLANEAWVASVERLNAALVTLDHLGYAQRPMGLFFGPAHLSFHCETMPILPGRMRIILPCPVQEPSCVPGRKGMPFRYWDVPPSLTEKARNKVRRRYLHSERELLVFHSCPNWAWRMAQQIRLPYYSVLSKMLVYYLADLARTVTVISVNNGHLLAPSENTRVRILNLAVLSRDEYEQLLLASDLMITENMVSVSIGKAVCSLTPCAVLRNSYRLVELLRFVESPLREIILEMEASRLGSVYPYEVFPIWGRQELEQLGLFNRNSLVAGFATVEVFGGEATRRELRSLLADQGAREAIRSGQRAYVQRLMTVDNAFETLRMIQEGAAPLGSQILERTGEPQ